MIEISQKIVREIDSSILMRSVASEYLSDARIAIFESIIGWNLWGGFRRGLNQRQIRTEVYAGD